ncbi:MAG: hypothetical protein OZSIB_3357 [Candidatus Ozemobacter sibiricus]|uniref:Uncharacterized protein n=1 Tax=Candidatus Ozemobacter sibiricus TaxID=2268124 RepID=A0A367ZD46_9BACT|nr:MAG: hypothetical protein OZSIB_3357 [Candidatus Ozemobacter sibiricus]
MAGFAREEMMIWFFAFSTLGVAVFLFLCSMRQLKELGWRTWLSTLGSLAVVFLLAREDLKNVG